jgi:uncharacterized protein YgbK (DUF1537 family)
VVYNTGTRNVKPEEAAEVIRRVCDTIDAGTCTVIGKRIDSTLRGNIKPELEVMGECFPDRLVLLTPAFPRAGRRCVSGKLLVGDVLIQYSDASRDPFHPQNTSSVPELLGLDASCLLPLETIAAGASTVASEIREAYSGGLRLLVADAFSDKDIAVLARGALESGIAVLPADPGPLTAELAALTERADIENSRTGILFVVGSVAVTVVRQIEALRKTYPVLSAELQTAALLSDPDKEIQRVLAEFEPPASGDGILLLCTDSLFKGIIQGERATFSDAVKIASGLSRAARILLDRNPRIGGVICSGGDIALALCRELGLDGLEISGEVEALIACGSTKEKGLKIISKGGMAGSVTAFVKCVEYLWGV